MSGWDDFRILFQLAGVCVTVGVILAQIHSLKGDVEELQKTLRNGVSEKINTIAQTVVKIETKCSERAAHHQCERGDR